jgi:hypothetical protein
LQLSRPVTSKSLTKQQSLIVVGLLFVASVAPGLLVEIPAMIDYVNHLARMHLLVDAAAGRPNPAYEIHWRFYPNLSMDILVPVLARFVSVLPLACSCLQARRWWSVAR